MKKSLNVGVVGCGAIGKEHIKRLTEVVPETKVTAVSDYFEDVAKEIAKEYGAKAYTDSFELINSDDVDAVVITSTDDTHDQFVMECLKVGKYVFCEKPLALTQQECEDMMKAEQKWGKRLVQVGFMRRFDKGYREMKKAFDEGEIGEALMVHCAHRVMSEAPGFQTDYAITRVAIHEIDICRWLLNQEYEEVQVLKVKQSRRTMGDWLNPQLVMLTTKDGQRIDVEVQSDGAYAYDIQCQIVGEDGTLNLPDPAFVTKRSTRGFAHNLEKSWIYRFIEAYDIELKEWALAVLEEKLTGPSTWDGYAACVAADALIKSRQTGQPEKVNMIEKPDIYNDREEN